MISFCYVSHYDPLVSWKLYVNHSKKISPFPKKPIKLHASLCYVSALGWIDALQRVNSLISEICSLFSGYYLLSLIQHYVMTQNPHHTGKMGMYAERATKFPLPSNLQFNTKSQILGSQNRSSPSPLSTIRCILYRKKTK